MPDTNESRHFVPVSKDYATMRLRATLRAIEPCSNFYLIILVKERAWDLFAQNFPKYRIIAGRGGLRLLYFSRHFSPTSRTSHWIAVSQMSIGIHGKIR